MKRSVLLSLFVTASMMASTSFAAEEDLCTTNLQTIENYKAQISPEMSDQVAASVKKAQASHALGTKKGTEDCIAETTQTIQDIQKTTDGGKTQ
ncbi:hypothetical protein [Pseudomonas fluorescens]|uniref:Uncharacterized protein n=1 Tax=Pseudomonas fluorescens TaxID=294 RepID=A0A5E7FCW3_PSEFL|nr:hypothetical protein [Pseudomonas fluorescens]VVO37308.1 hypothetical protein PS833_05485 [Pseudomonas fluorescens]VVP68387.1 hypothetical protein PS914_00696 [Pseudomonas fluorescens]